MAGSVNKAIIENLYVSEMRSIPDISAITGNNRSAVRKTLIDSGVKLRSRSEGVRLVTDKISETLRGRKREPFSEEWKSNIKKGRQKWGEKNAVGISLKPSGYLEVTRGPNKGKSQHVVIMEERLGRALLHDECVHHIDGNRQNNSPDNLALMTRSGHARHHRIFDIHTRERAENGRFR